MNRNESIERDLRYTIGDLMFQLIILRAELTELQGQFQELQQQVPQTPQPPIHTNGAHVEAEARQ